MLIVGKNLGVDISGRTIFKAIDLRIEPGTSMAIVGASGSGKTTLLNCLGLLIKPTHGDVIIDDRVMSNAARSEVLKFWRDSAAFVYQDSGVIDDESVGYNVSLSRKAEKYDAKSIE
ncbi:MAG: ATP-binding cassette domain-containing protein, partial [Limosilactobacillus mucosae]